MSSLYLQCKFYTHILVDTGHTSNLILCVCRTHTHISQLCTLLFSVLWQYYCHPLCENPVLIHLKTSPVRTIGFKSRLLVRCWVGVGQVGRFGQVVQSRLDILGRGRRLWVSCCRWWTGGQVGRFGQVVHRRWWTWWVWWTGERSSWWRTRWLWSEFVPQA